MQNSNRRTTSQPITDAVYGKKGRRADKPQPVRRTFHTVTSQLAGKLGEEGLAALTALLLTATRPERKPRRRGRRS